MTVLIEETVVYATLPASEYALFARADVPWLIFIAMNALNETSGRTAIIARDTFHDTYRAYMMPAIVVVIN